MEMFNLNNNWYKGNIHTHTTLSDGLWDPDKCIKAYKNKGYSFLAITDHRKFSKGCEEDGFTILSGAEYDMNDFKSKKAYHILGIDTQGEISIDDTWHPQQIINAIKEKNGLAIISHPFWSLLTHQDIMELEGYDGIEIWNTVSETNSMRGDSTDYIDVIAARGNISHIFAVDDTHFYKDDLFGGYIVVNSPSLKTKDIMENIYKGNFYCSQGPEIKQIIVNKDNVKVYTSSVKQINFMSDTFYCSDRVCHKNRQDIDEAIYTIKSTDTILRIECIDKNGKKAWSQIIKL